MVKDSVQILEEVTEDELYRVPIRYYHVERGKEETVESCQGDLITICNALSDYADMLNDYLGSDEKKLDHCGIMQYEHMRDRCWNISRKLQKKIGYDRDAAIEKCRKKALRKSSSDLGIGEEALILSARRAAADKERAEQKAAKTTK